MFKIAAVVVLYNPELSVIKNINSYVDQVEKLYAVDNSAVLDDSILGKIKSLNKATYISNNTNIGIAAALNIAAKKAIEDGFEYLLTMDQDSEATYGMVKILLDIMLSYNGAGIVTAEQISLPFQEQNDSKFTKEILYTMTSGNLLNLSAYNKSGDFLEKLFIDHVDHEYCLRLYKNNYKVIKTNRVLVYHKLGNTDRRKLFRWIFYPSHHSPLRLYYRTRNRFYVDKLYRKSFPEYARLDIKNFIRELFEIIAFDKGTLEKIKMIVTGYIHYKKNQFGKYPDAVNR